MLDPSFADIDPPEYPALFPVNMTVFKKRRNDLELTSTPNQL